MGNAKTLKTLLLLTFFFALCFSVYADNEETYVWWDEKGQVQYSKTKPDWWKEAEVDPHWKSVIIPQRQRRVSRVYVRTPQDDLAEFLLGLGHSSPPLWHDEVNLFEKWEQEQEREERQRLKRKVDDLEYKTRELETDNFHRSLGLIK